MSWSFTVSLVVVDGLNVLVRILSLPLPLPLALALALSLSLSRQATTHSANRYRYVGL